MSLNFRALRYFWTVARLGTLRRAAAELRVSEPAVSAQIRKLQRRVGLRLFEKRGRRLVLTQAGRLAADYAGEIFRLGDELADQLRRGAEGMKLRLTVGLTQGVPKMLVQQLLAPVVEDDTIGLVVVEGTPTGLVGDLAAHAVDLVLADGAIPVDPGVRIHTHLLGACGVSFLAGAPLAERMGEGAFPRILDRAPWLLPSPGIPLRQALDVWMGRREIRPRIEAEFDDSALLTAFGAAGDGVFACPTAVEGIIVARYRARVLGRTEEIRESFYAMSMEAPTSHRGVLAMEGVARTLFP